MIQFIYDLIHDKATFEKHLGNIGVGLVIGGLFALGLIAVIAIIIKN